MKLLFDHNVPKRLRLSLKGHDVWTAQEMGWSELTNGDLLKATEDHGFAVMLTGDKNLRYSRISLAANSRS